MLDLVGYLRRIMNQGAAETFDQATDSLEAIANAIGCFGTSRQDWYVDGTNGAAGNDGRSPDSPFLTIAQATAAAAAGDIIHIAEDTYDEAVSIPAALAGLQVLCEAGVILVNTTPGTVVSVAAPYVRWQGGNIAQAAQVGINVTGDYFHGIKMLVSASSIGFDMDGSHAFLERCRATNFSTTGFDIQEHESVFFNCTAYGQAGTRGFYLNHTNAHNNMFIRCATLNCTAAGYQCIAGADENLFSDCSQSSLCAGPTDAGANNSFANHKEESQITGGNSVQDDLNALNTRQGRVLCCLDFWSTPQEEVQLTAVAGDKSLPDVTVADLPAGATIVRAIAFFKFRMVENTNAAANKLNGAQEIQVRDDTPGAWTDAINFVDDQFTLAASTREGGDVVVGAIDVAGTVDGNDTYNFQWDEAVADLGNIQFNDVQVGLRIWFSI